MRDEPGWELCAPRPYSVVCFRPEGDDARSEALLEAVNASGEVYLSHTRLNDRHVLRLAIGNGATTEDDVRVAWEVLQREAARLGAGARGGRLMRVLVLQHIACEPPGVFEDVLARARARARARRARRGRAAARGAVGRDRRDGRPDERQRRGRASLARRARRRRSRATCAPAGRSGARAWARSCWRPRSARASTPDRRPRSACSRSS